VSWKCRWATRFNNFKKSFSHESRGDGGDTSELREIADRWKTCVGLVSAGPSKGGTQQEEGAIIHRS
jgi:hypothetical protein